MNTVWYILIAAAVIAVIYFVGRSQPRKAAGRSEDAAGEETAHSDGAPADAQAAPVTAPLPIVSAFEPGPALTPKDGAFYAVLTAAIGETLAREGVNPDGGFAIRSVRPVSAPGARKLTPKDDAFYAVVTAAIAETLAAEGVNPETGFAITAVTPV